VKASLTVEIVSYISFFSSLQIDLKSNTNALIGVEYVVNLSPLPISFVMTEFHALLLYSDRIKGVSKLSREVIFEEEVSQKS